MTKNKSPFPSWLPLITLPLIFIVSRNINNNRNVPTQRNIPQQQSTPYSGFLTAKQAIDIYKQNPDWAKAECQILRKLNNSGQGVSGEYWLSRSIQNYKMTRLELELMNISIPNTTFKQNPTVAAALITKKMRSQSGIFEVAILTSPWDMEGAHNGCDFDCYMCPNQKKKFGSQ